MSITVSWSMYRSYYVPVPEQRVPIFEQHIAIKRCKCKSIPVKSTRIAEFSRIFEDECYIRRRGNLCPITFAQKWSKLNMVAMIMSYEEIINGLQSGQMLKHVEIGMHCLAGSIPVKPYTWIRVQQQAITSFFNKYYYVTNVIVLKYTAP